MYSDKKNPLKFTVLDLFCDIFAEIWIKMNLHNISRPSRHETKYFAKKHFLNKILKVDNR